MADDDEPKLLGVRVAAPKCVRCGQPVQPRFRPFCGQRCADIDLGSWFSGAYRVASDEAPEDASLAGSNGDEEPEKP